MFVHLLLVSKYSDWRKAQQVPGYSQKIDEKVLGSTKKSRCDKNDRVAFRMRILAQQLNSKKVGFLMRILARLGVGREREVREGHYYDRYDYFLL